MNLSQIHKKKKIVKRKHLTIPVEKWQYPFVTEELKGLNTYK